MSPASSSEGPHDLDVGSFDRELVERILRQARTKTAAALQSFFEERRASGLKILYDQIADYPFREGKGLRPGILYAACRAMGGTDRQAVDTATAIELFHNGALVHDDIVDGSKFRRGGETLFRRHGVPIAINAGDATYVFCLSLLLRNISTLGVRKALKILQEFERLSRESVEGQAMELEWISKDIYDLSDDDYVRMAYKKTCWYTIIAPMRLGVVCGSGPSKAADLDRNLLGLLELGFFAGIGFQVQDDLLNLTADEVLYGKEISGDLFEGKRTIMLLHFLRTAGPRIRARAMKLLTRPRREKKASEIQWLHAAMRDNGSFEYGREFARSYIVRALELETEALKFMPKNDDRLFLREMLNFVIFRLK
jgi:geranylgeranyl diphosphate synthase type II